MTPGAGVRQTAWMDSKRLLTADEAWSGACYELLFSYAPGALLNEPLRALWSSPLLDGPVASRESEVWDQPMVDLRDLVDDFEEETVGAWAFAGALRLPDRRMCPCASNAYRHADGDGEIELYVYEGALERLFPGFYERSDWISQMNSAFVAVADHVFARSPFLSGLIGFEIDTPGPFADAQVVPAGVYGFLDVADGRMSYRPTGE
jgi:hypothetical protein